MAHQERIKQLKAGQPEIKTWLREVNKKIVELEDSYLAETNLGNIVRGWDIDGKNQRSTRVDDKDGIKEKLFSCSSHEVFIDMKLNLENDQFRSSQVKLDSIATQGGQKGAPPKGLKKGRKSLMAKKEDADWGQYGDY